MHEWMTDNGQTPHLVVDAGIEGVVVPRQYVRDGKIVLNASYTATAGLVIKNDWITFSARFSGTSFDVHLPVRSVLAIYARENGQGMMFSDDDLGSVASAPGGADGTPGKPKPTGGDKPKRPSLKVVK